MLTLRSVTLPVLLGILFACGYFSSGASGVLADEPWRGSVSAMPADLGAPLVSQGVCVHSVNGSVPGPNGCTSTTASTTYTYYPPGYVYNAAYNYCYTYYPTCQYYHSYYGIDSVYPQVYAVDCTDPYFGTVWVAQSMNSFVCY
jgi:hypothetical protein